MALILDGTDGISASSGTELFPDGEIGIDKLTTTGTPSAATFLRGDAEWSAVPDPLPSSTKMMFVQTAAPTGWTKDTTHDNKALRVVSGTAGTGGSVAFTTAFASQGVSGTVGNTTLTTTQMPSHSHSVRHSPVTDRDGNGDRMTTTNFGAINNLSGLIDAAGGNGSHNHSFTGTAINMAVQYVDVIIATKD